MGIKENIAKLKEIMAEKNVDAYIVPSDDFHGSEYVGKHFKSRAFITGFTGSAGTAVILQEKYASKTGGITAGLWTDGRYFLQAEEQLSGSGITLFKSGEPGVPDIKEFLANALKCAEQPEQKGSACSNVDSNTVTIGFDGRVMSAGSAREVLDALKSVKLTTISYSASHGKTVSANIKVNVNTEDLIDSLWAQRPPLACSRAEIFPEKFAGKSRAQKLEELAAYKEKKGADMLVLSTLDDIAWLLNIRGKDVEYNPVLLSYFILDGSKNILFAQEAATAGIADTLRADGVELRPYDSFYDYLEEHCRGKIIADESRINYRTFAIIREKGEIVPAKTYDFITKSIKNDTETANIRKAHLKDGVAETKWIFWLKKNVGKLPMTEISVADKLAEYRAAQENNRGESFDPIMGYREHGAIIHYSATEVSNKTLEKEGFLLADTGGQYLDGTTDITRTIALGPLTDEEKRSYTAVLRGHLNLQNAVFDKNTLGSALDEIARKPLEEIGLDYNHGTGHGVGFYLNVHEDPYRISKKKLIKNDMPLAAGVLISNEPGVYIAGKYGIRIENLVLCKEASEQSLCFEALTLVPYEREAVLPEMMTEREKNAFNAYQKNVYDKLSPFLDEGEKAWLAEATEPI